MADFQCTFWLQDPNKHIPPSNTIYLIELLNFNFWVACQPTIGIPMKIESCQRIHGTYNMLIHVYEVYINSCCVQFTFWRYCCSSFRTSEFIGLDFVCHAFYICTDKAKIYVCQVGQIRSVRSWHTQHGILPWAVCYRKCNAFLADINRECPTFLLRFHLPVGKPQRLTFFRYATSLFYGSHRGSLF